MNDEVRKMLATPGLWVVSAKGAEHYAVVLVEADGTCHQMRPLDMDKATNKAAFKKDGVLSSDGWRDDVVCTGPVPYDNV